MFLGNQVRFDAAELKTVYGHYQNNLFDIISIFSRQQTPVIISTVGTNLKDFPPLESQHGSGLSEPDLAQWQELVDRGLKQLEAGKLPQAITSLTRAEQIDAEYAELQFLLGQTHLRMQNLDEAKNISSRPEIWTHYAFGPIAVSMQLSVKLQNSSKTVMSHLSMRQTSFLNPVNRAFPATTCSTNMFT